MIIENINNYHEFTAEVFKKSLAIVEKRNCTTYKLLGYKYLDVRLILNFHDCNEVYDFTFNGKVMEVKSFFTLFIKSFILILSPLLLFTNFCKTILRIFDSF